MSAVPSMTVPTETGIEEAAKGLEAYFLRQVLGQIHILGGAEGGGPAASTFEDMFVEMLAESVADSGQVGLAQTFEAQLRAPGTNPAGDLDVVDLARPLRGSDTEKRSTGPLQIAASSADSQSEVP